jgi:fructokinase
MEGDWTVIVVCGEALVDVVPDAAGVPCARPGGSPANVAVALARLGVPAALLARLSSDHFGQMLRDHLRGSGVDLSLAVPTGAPTPVAAVTLDAAGVASYRFDLDGRTDDGWSVADLPATLPVGAALHVSGAFALVRPAMRTTVDTLLARESGRRVICFDPNPRAALAPDRSTLLRWVGRADLVRASAEDLELTDPGEPVEVVARRWRAFGPSVVVVTLGGGGVYALGPAGACAAPAEPVDVVDTVGAGDAFTAGLLAFLAKAGALTPEALSRLDIGLLRDALAFAQRAAAITCTRPGADPPWAAELESTVD